MLLSGHQKRECATENYFVIFGTRQHSYDKSQKRKSSCKHGIFFFGFYRTHAFFALFDDLGYRA